MFSEDVVLGGGILALLMLSFTAQGQQSATNLDCSTLTYVKRTSAWLCGEASVCSGDICLRPSQYDFDEEFDVVLRDRRGNKLDSRRLSYERRNFCFEGRKDGDYQLAFVLYEKGVRQPARIFPTKYKHNPNKPNNKTYMIEATCPDRAR